MQDTEKQLIEEKFRGVYARLDSNNDLVHERLKQLIDLQKKTHEQALKTNGRVNALEKQTIIVRWMSEKPLRFFAIIGLMVFVFHNIPNDFWKLIKLF